MNQEELAKSLLKQLRCNTEISLSDLLNDFSRGEIGVLSYLVCEKNEVSAGELSTQLNVTTARIAKILKSLEAKKYIIRKKEEKDKRKTVVAITKKGKELAKTTEKEIIRKITKVIAEIGEEQIKEYIKMALKISEILNKL